LGLGAIADYLAAYEAESGTTVDPARFRFWTIYRTVWWALGCLKMAAQWRSGADRMLERVVISRRTSEQELDLLLLLEEDAPEAERVREVWDGPWDLQPSGEAASFELAVAVSEWLDSVKGKLSGHDRFQLAVARNALGMITREHSDIIRLDIADANLCQDILKGKKSLETEELLRDLRSDALRKLRTDVPKYPAHAHARKKWTGED
jgi:hypothetical protein